MAQTDIERYMQRLGALKTERSSWIPHYQDITNYLLPRKGRYLTTDVNDGRKRDNNIYDSTAIRALRVMTAGMMAGMTSPARPWFRMTTTDPELAESANVKAWLDAVTQLMRDIFARSNTYRVLHNMYEELGAFGTASAAFLDDFQDVTRGYAFTAGEYCIAESPRNTVDTLYREFQMTIGQVVAEFGKDKISQHVASQFNAYRVDSYVTLCHVIEPRINRDTSKPDSRNMRFKSVYFEKGGDTKATLRESGFDDFPVLAPRWAVNIGDVYGQGPGREALGDIKQLQHQQLRKGQAIDYQTKPPLQIPISMKNQHNSFLPGGHSYYDGTNPTGGVRTAYDVELRLDFLLEDIKDVRERINSTFYADLFLMISQMEGIQPRNQFEIAERHEEKLLMLGPVLERLHNEMLDLLIDRTFAQSIRADILPIAPRELQGSELKVEYVSMLAQAQQAVGLGAVDRLIGIVGAVASAKPEAIDKLNADETIDHYADMLGTPAELLVANEDVAIIRQSRVEEAQALQQAQMASEAASNAKTLSETDVEGDNALTKMFTQL